MDLEQMTVEQLTQYLDELDRQRLRIREQARAARGLLSGLLAYQHAAQYGLTPEQYREAKVAAAESGMPLTNALNRARRVQVAKATAASIGVAARR
jgi:hypothetical protein